MPEEKQDISGLVESLVSPLVDYEDDLEITSREEEGMVYVDISVNEADTGKVIGRQGRVINSIRTLARAAASRNDLRVEVEIVD